MYLTRLILNPRSRRVRRELADVYQLHRSIMRAFPETLPSDERVLFRPEVDNRSGVVTVLVQSRYRPNWAWLAEDEGYALATSDENPCVKEWWPSFSGGQTLFFRLRANPTVKREGKRHALFREEEQQAWVERKMLAAGCRLLSMRASYQGHVEGRTRNRDSLRVAAVQFDGVLLVDDPPAFQSAVENGIGPAKGLGFGLISVATSP